ncbi:unnamed protein product [Urochloa humidicola]
MPSFDYPGKQLGNFRSSQVGTKGELMTACVSFFPNKEYAQREVVSTLIFTAAWFPNLPEQLDLSTCSLRYGSFVEPFDIHEFI